MLQRLLLIAVAGSLGALARYGLAGLVHRSVGASFPWGTLVVNLLGCFAAGALIALFEHRWQLSGELRIIVLVGFMGAFTTFSAFIVETGELMRTADWMLAVGNLALQNGLGLVALFAGLALGKLA
jgi:fluoride exporter